MNPDNRSYENTPERHYPIIVEEKMPLGKKLAVTSFIVIGIILIIALVILAKPEKNMVCDRMPAGANSLTTFGTCHEE